MVIEFNFIAYLILENNTLSGPLTWRPPIVSSVFFGISTRKPLQLGLSPILFEFRFYKLIQCLSCKCHVQRVWNFETISTKNLLYLHRVSEDRRAGDQDPALRVVAETSKLIDKRIAKFSLAYVSWRDLNISLLRLYYLIKLMTHLHSSISF